MATKKILIVEDEAISAMALQLTVARMGHEVIGPVDTGEDALRYAIEHHPDLVLMDTRLRTPMTGVEAANILWASAGIRSVFISAYNAAELQGGYRGAEPFMLLVKPVLEDDLQEVIAQLCATEPRG